MLRIFFFLSIFICSFIKAQEDFQIIPLEEENYALKIYTNKENINSGAGKAKILLEFWNTKKGIPFYVSKANINPIIQKVWEEDKTIKVLLRSKFVGTYKVAEFNYIINFSRDFNYLSYEKLDNAQIWEEIHSKSFVEKIRKLGPMKRNVFFKDISLRRRENNLSLLEYTFSSTDWKHKNNMLFSGSVYTNYLLSPFLKGWRGEKYNFIKDLKKFNPDIKYKTVDWDDISSEMVASGFENIGEAYNSMDENDPMAEDLFLVETGANLIGGAIGTLIAGAFDAMFQDCEIINMINSPNNKDLFVVFVKRTGSTLPNEIFNNIYVYPYGEDGKTSNTITNIYKGHTSYPYELYYNPKRSILLSQSQNEAILWNFSNDIVTTKVLPGIFGKQWKNDSTLFIQDLDGNLGEYLVRSNHISWFGVNQNFIANAGKYSKEFWFVSDKLPIKGNELSGYTNYNTKKVWFEEGFYIGSNGVYKTIFNADESARYGACIIKYNELGDTSNRKLNIKSTSPEKPTDDITTKLYKLKELYEKKLITKEDYDQKRKQILESL